MEYGDKNKNGSPEMGVVGPGDTYVGLNYVQYAYVVRSEAISASGKREASLEMKFQSRLVPLFQFAAFYKDDLEFHPGPPMTLNGRVHTNSNLFLNSGESLAINGKTTVGSYVYRFGKDGRSCGSSGSAGVVTVKTIIMPCNGTSTDTTSGMVTGNLLDKFNKDVLDKQQSLTIPTIDTLRPDPSNELWSGADVRIVAVKTGASTFQLQVLNANKSPNSISTARLNACNTTTPPTVRINTLYDGREKQMMTIMEVDQQKLMDCINGGGFTEAGGNTLTLDNTTGGGMVWNFSFSDSTNSVIDAAINGVNSFPTSYGIKITNAATLGASTGVPPIRGLTIVSLKGDYNLNSKKPAAILADAINVLSNSVNEPLTADISTGKAVPTTVNAAFLSGIDTTTGSNYNGGLQNYIRFHEDWGGVKMTYKGSFVSLGNSLHTKGKQSGSGVTTYYQAPNRDWGYDTDFNDANNLPPLTPRFVYLRQLLFARSW